MEGVLEPERENVWVRLFAEHGLLRGAAAALGLDTGRRLVGAHAEDHELPSTRGLFHT